MPDHSDTERSIGELKGELRIITGLVNRVLDGQNDASVQLRAHAEQDRHDFSEIKDALGLHRDRIARMEVIADTVESHGDAILTMERRLTDQEIATKARDAADSAVRQNNKRWMAAAGAAGSVAGVGVHGLGPKLWAGLAGFFK